MDWWMIEYDDIDTILSALMDLWRHSLHHLQHK